MSRGGVRLGAGRPPKAADDKRPRPQHQIRAHADEWELIKRFSKMVKDGNLKEIETTLDVLEQSAQKQKANK